MNSTLQRFSSHERIALTVAVCIIAAFGANLEKRTALRRTPMTDLGVFACAASAVVHGENIYNVHEWHYQYPPALAILFVPLSQPIPIAPPTLEKGEHRTEANTPWGYETDREPGIRLELLAKETFKRTMHVRYGSDPMNEKPPLLINARLRTSWLAQKANRAARTDPHLAESLIEVAIRK